MHPDCVIHPHEQGSPEWHAARNGLLTASEMNLALTPTLKPSNNANTRKHVFELAAQRISGHTEPTYIGDEMLRGHADEITARDLYSENYEPVEELGFITRDFGGFTIGYSPDGGCVMSPRGIEIKSRRQKYLVQTVVDGVVPDEHMLQVQTGLLVTGWDEIAFITYCGGMPLSVIDCKPIAEYQDAILKAAEGFEAKIKEVVEKYQERVAAYPVVIETEREGEAQEVYFDAE